MSYCDSLSQNDLIAGHLTFVVVAAPEVSLSVRGSVHSNDPHGNEPNRGSRFVAKINRIVVHLETFRRPVQIGFVLC